MLRIPALWPFRSGHLEDLGYPYGGLVYGLMHHSGRGNGAIYMLFQQRNVSNNDFVLVTDVVWAGPPIIMGGRETSP